jgi:hypothetical protein
MTAANDFPWTDENVTRLKQLVDKGLTGRAIGDELGISGSAVISKLKRIGLSLRGAKRAFGERSKPRQPKPPTRSGFNPTFKIVSRKPLPAAPPLSPDQKEYIGGPGLPLTELTQDDCRWPINTPEVTVISSFQRRVAPYLFCGERVADGGFPYCPYHCGMGYQAANGMKRREYVRREVGAV